MSWLFSYAYFMFRLLTMLFLIISILGVISYGWAYYADRFGALALYYIAIYLMLLIPACALKAIQYFLERPPR